MSVTQQDAINWLHSTVGQHLDYDQKYGQQCFDYFNYYYQFITGENPYSKGYAVPSAKDIWNIPDTTFTNLPDSTNLVPQPGDAAIYGAAWGSGNGHVEMVMATDNGGCTFIGENEHNNPNEGVVQIYRTWQQMRGLLGVRRPNWSTPPPQPAPNPVVIPEPVIITPAAPPAPYIPPAIPNKGTLAKKYKVIETIMYFDTALDAKTHANAKGTLSPSADYFDFGDDGQAKNLSTDNMKDQNKWINIQDNVIKPKATVVQAVADVAKQPPIMVVPAANVADISWKDTLKPILTSGLSVRYRVLQAMYIHDQNGPGGVEIAESTDDKSTWLPIKYYMVRNNMTYLVPFMGSDKPDQNNHYAHYYAIPTTNIDYGIPNMTSELYESDLLSEHEYRKQQGRETFDDKIYDANQAIASLVKNGARFLDIIKVKITKR